MPLRPIAEDVWEIRGEVSLPGGARLPIRTVLLRLPDGGVWLHSPVALTDSDAAAIDAIGPVTHLVAPSRLHHLFFGDAARRWPSAHTWGAPGLAAKRPDLRFQHTLGEPDAAWPAAVVAVPIDGAPSLSETVFFHAASRTLICTDLVFHVLKSSSWMTPWVLRLTGTWGRLALSRVWWFATRDRAAAASSVSRVLALNFDRVVMAHGEILESDARARMTATLAWMSRGVRAVTG
jgi:hypothetical protein